MMFIYFVEKGPGLALCAAVPRGTSPESSPKKPILTSRPFLLVGAVHAHAPPEIIVDAEGNRHAESYTVEEVLRHGADRIRHVHHADRPRASDRCGAA